MKPLSLGQHLRMPRGRALAVVSDAGGFSVDWIPGPAEFNRAPRSARLLQDGEYRVGWNGIAFLLPWQEENDPILRALRKLDIPVGRLRHLRSNGSTQVELVDKFHSRLVADVPVRMMCPRRHKLGGIFEGCSWAIEYVEYRPEFEGFGRHGEITTSDDRFVRIDRVFVTPQTNPEALETALNEVLSGTIQPVK